MSILPNADEIEGNYEQAKGKVKEEIGDLTDNTSLEAEGEAEQAAGKAQEEYGEVKHDVGDTVAEETDDFFDDAKDKIKEWDSKIRNI